MRSNTIIYICVQKKIFREHTTSPAPSRNTIRTLLNISVPLRSNNVKAVKPAAKLRQTKPQPRRRRTSNVQIGNPHKSTLWRDRPDGLRLLRKLRDVLRSSASRKS